MTKLYSTPCLLRACFFQPTRNGGARRVVVKCFHSHLPSVTPYIQTVLGSRSLVLSCSLDKERCQKLNLVVTEMSWHKLWKNSSWRLGLMAFVISLFCRCGFDFSLPHSCKDTQGIPECGEYISICRWPKVMSNPIRQELWQSLCSVICRFIYCNSLFKTCDLKLLQKSNMPTFNTSFCRLSPCFFTVLHNLLRPWMCIYL